MSDSNAVNFWKGAAGVVTGGTRGIGLGIAKCLVARGVAVAITHLSNPQAARNAESLLKGLARDGQRVLLLQGDAGDPAVVDHQIRQINREIGEVSILVNNAGIMVQGTFESLDDRTWEETLRINLSSTFYWCSRVIPAMKAAGRGRIVNISSIAARGGGVIGPHYAASKAGMVGLTRYAARELASSGITVNAIAPAFIEDAGIFASWSDEQRAVLRQKVIVPRAGNVQDCVRAFEYLLDSPFVTGVTLDVCGGAFMI